MSPSHSGQGKAGHGQRSCTEDRGQTEAKPSVLQAVGAALGRACTSFCNPSTSVVEKVLSSKHVTSTKGKLLDEFTVGKCLGRGSFGVVSHCTRRSTGEEYAVKVVDMSMVSSSRIRREAELLAMIDHKHVVRLHDCYYHGRGGRFFCFVMDRYEGGDMIDGLERRGCAIGCKEAAHLVRQVADGIKHLHERGVVHRDIKGENVLMDKTFMDDPTVHCAITDFGAATKWAPGQRLHDHTGTRLFWSPELWDKDYCEKVDVWALGAVLYSLVTFRLPFPDEQSVRWSQAALPDNLHPGCADLICWMLQKKEDMRASVGEVIAHDWLAYSGSPPLGDNEVVSYASDASLGSIPEDAVLGGEAACGGSEAAPSPSLSTTQGEASSSSGSCSSDSHAVEEEPQDQDLSPKLPECNAMEDDPFSSAITWTLQRVGAQLHGMLDADKGKFAQNAVQAISLVVPGGVVFPAPGDEPCLQDIGNLVHAFSNKG